MSFFRTLLGLTPTYVAPKTGDEHIRALLAEHGNTRHGLYILKRAFLLAHGAGKGSVARIVLSSNGRTVDPRKLRKAKAIIAQG